MQSTVRPPPFGLSCAAILLCLLSPSAARSVRSPPDFVLLAGPLLTSARRANLECNTKPYFINNEATALEMLGTSRNSKKTLVFFRKWALRADVSQGPAKRTHVRWEANAPSSPWTQMAQQNCGAGTPEGRQDGPCSTCPPDEHAVWHSHLSLKGASGGLGHAVPDPRHVISSPTPILKAHNMSLEALHQF